MIDRTPEICQAMLREQHEKETIYPRVNSERYSDPTPYAAVHKIEEDKQRANKMINIIRSLCELCGYHIQGKITLVDNKTGHRYTP